MGDDVVNPIQVKAYDFPALVEELKVYLKDQGLDMAEELIKGLVVKTLGWTKKSIQESSTPFDDFVLPFLATAEAAAMKEIDKIDGKVG